MAVGPTDYMSNLTNKIEADNRNIDQVLNQKYVLDYFQREYNWERKHVEQLVTDLATAFRKEYRKGHNRKQGRKYNNYYLGPFVISEGEDGNSIIDGQQRLTTITLFLIYLNHLQKDLNCDEKIEPMIFSEIRGEKSFNIQAEERRNCLEELFKNGKFSWAQNDNESTINMAERYDDIDQAFPDELRDEGILPFFLDWLRFNVVLVEIKAYSSENAYTIFETMNDRGLNLTPTEMLKAYALSNFTDDQRRRKADQEWKRRMQELHDRRDNKEEDQHFFQAWLRSQYAETIRSGTVGSGNEDFEKIGTRFHSWVRDNLEKLRLSSNSSESFEGFINDSLGFYLRAYTSVLGAQDDLTSGLEHVYYIKRWGIAESLAYPLLLAPLRMEDEQETIQKKMNLVARYIETFAVRRSVNYRRFSASSIRYTMNSLVKEIRGVDLDRLTEILQDKLSSMDERLDGLDEFGLHGQNKKFVKFFLARITAFVEQQAGMKTSFSKYHDRGLPSEKPFEIEHIWADNFAEFRHEFEQEKDFDDYRNAIGGLLLLPHGTNQALGGKSYSDKLPHYLKENLLAQSLHSSTYSSNPNFLKRVRDELSLPFEAYEKFGKDELDERQELYKAIAKCVWADDLAMA